MLKVRIEGLPDEVKQFIEKLQTTGFATILNESGQYPNRGKSSYVRSYLDVQVNECPRKEGRKEN